MRQILRLFLVLLLALAVSAGARGTVYAQDGSYLDRAVDRLERMHGGGFTAAGGAGDDQQVPDNQQGGGGGEVTKTFQLELTGTPSADQGFVVVSIAADPENDSELFFSVVEFCGEVPDISAELAQLEAELEAEGIEVTVEYIQNNDPCEGNGTIYAESVTYPAGVQAYYSFVRLDANNQEGEVVSEGEETIDTNMTNSASYNFGGKGAGDDQQVPDNQQAGGGKDTGAGDDQQDAGTGAGDDQQDSGAGAGKTPDNQQGGGGDTVTKTFELTLNGDVPADRAFGVAFGTLEQFESDQAQDVIFCGQPEAQAGDVVVSDDDCVGGGTTYTYSAELPEGTELYFAYITVVEGDEQNTIEFFFGNLSFDQVGEAEVLDADMTNTAWYTFGTDTGAGDDQQDDGTGAGDDQQDDTQDEIQDDQQGEMPEELPDTGAGGLAPVGLPVGGVLAALAAVAALGMRLLHR